MQRRRRRWTWIFLGGVVLGGAVCVALLLAPPVQGWLLRKFVARQPGWRLDFAEIGVGPTGLDADGLAFAMPGIEARSAPLAIRVAPARLFSKRELGIERVEARKILLTLTPAQFAPVKPSGRPAPPFDGVLRLLQAPLPWTLDAAHLDGDIVVRDGNESRLKGTFSLRGGGLSPDTPGVFSYALSADSMILPPGPDHKFTSAGTLRVVQTFAHGIARVAIEGDLHLPRYGALVLPPGRVTLEVTETRTGEHYAGRLALGTAVSLELDAALNAATSVVTGHATLHVNQAVIASLLGARSPSAQANGTLVFTVNLASGDLTAAVTGDFDGRDWQKLLPQLAAIDALRGRLTAAFARHGDRFVIEHLDATLRGEKSAAEATLSLPGLLAWRGGELVMDPVSSNPPVAGRPVSTTLPAFRSLAEISLVHWPVQWANPFLASAQLAPGEFSASWGVALDHGVVIALPLRAATLGPLALRGDQLPSLPSWQFTFRPHFAASVEKASLTLDEINGVSSGSDRLEAQLVVSRDAASGEIVSTGKFHATVPSLLASPNPAEPFAADGLWDVALTGRRLRLAVFGFALRGEDTAACLSLESLRPLDIDLEKLRVMPVEPGAAPDLFRLRFSRLPLAAFARWLPGLKIAGTLAAGETWVAASTDDRPALRTTVPWQFENMAIGVASAPTAFRFNAQFSPNGTHRGDQLAVSLDHIVVRAPSLTLTGGLALSRTKDVLAAESSLEVDLPTLPHSGESFGPLHASWHGKFHSLTPLIMGADEFSLRVKNAAGDRLTLTAPQPFLFGLSNSGSVAVSTLAPLQLKLGAFPLAWLRPWLEAPATDLTPSAGGHRRGKAAPLQLDGMVAPVELELSAKINAYTVHAVSPVRIDELTVSRAGRAWWRGATATLEPGLDLMLLAMTRPKFEMAYVGAAHVAGAKIELAGRRSVAFDLSLAFKGNDHVVLPNQVDFSSHVDFAALPNGAALGLPARGTLDARINGDLLGGKPLALSAHLAGLPAAEGQGSLPALDVTLRGKVRDDQTVAGSVKLQLAATPQPTDLAFNVRLNLADGGLNLTSGFRSQFIDAAALLAVLRAFSPPAASRSAAPAAQPATAARIAPVAASADLSETLPFWGELTGSFDLDVGALQFAPYRIDHLRGRIDADHRVLALRDLGGEMFAGHWGGGVRVEHDPGSHTGEHTLRGEFHIQQFESARVVQAVFPQQLASIDARIDVTASVASHGNSFVALVDHSTADFAVDGKNGVMRLTVPKSDLLSTAAVFGGTVLLSPELRALGRLLKKFAEMPVERLRIAGRRAENGEVSVDEFSFVSPQARLVGQGRIVSDPAQPLMNHPLELSLRLYAKDELAVILGGMGLLEKKPQPDGFRGMRRPFALGGRAGTPDTAPLYDLLASGVSGSHGTWGFLMRKVEAEVGKKKNSAPLR